MEHDEKIKRNEKYIKWYLVFIAAIFIGIAWSPFGCASNDVIMHEPVSKPVATSQIIFNSGEDKYTADIHSDFIVIYNHEIDDYYVTKHIEFITLKGLFKDNPKQAWMSLSRFDDVQGVLKIIGSEGIDHIFYHQFTNDVITPAPKPKNDMTAHKIGYLMNCNSDIIGTPSTVKCVPEPVFGDYN